MSALTLPDWVAREAGNRARLRVIMAAVHRCYMEHDPGQEVSGPHMTISMAEEFIRPMLKED